MLVAGQRAAATEKAMTVVEKQETVSFAVVAGAAAVVS